MQHVNTFNQVIKDFPEINDEDKAIIMLCSLPNSYEHLGTPPYIWERHCQIGRHHVFNYVLMSKKP
jgi:hypothetical protein